MVNGRLDTLPSHGPEDGLSGRSCQAVAIPRKKPVNLRQLDSFTKDKRALEELKRTPPQIDAELRLHNSGYFYVLIESKNFVSIKFLWDLLLIRTDDQKTEVDTLLGVVFNRNPDELYPAKENILLGVKEING
jgi:hypothetical protein